jgi:uncharacterized FlaG/YvyC family protein
MVTQVALSRIQAALTEVRVAPIHPTETAAIAEPRRAAHSGIKAFIANADEALPRLDPQALESAVKDLEMNVQNLQRSLQFSVDEVSGRTIIKVLDKETDEVIRQIPPAEIIAIARRIEDAVGLFVEDEA